MRRDRRAEVDCDVGDLLEGDLLGRAQGEGSLLHPVSLVPAPADDLQEPHWDAFNPGHAAGTEVETLIGILAGDLVNDVAPEGAAPAQTADLQVPRRSLAVVAIHGGEL